MENELVGRDYVAETMGITPDAVSSYATTNKDKLPPNARKVGRFWRWPKKDVDEFAARMKEQRANFAILRSDEDRHQFAYRPVRTLTAQEIVDAGYELSSARQHELGV